MQEEYNQNQCCEQDEQQKQEEIRELGSTRPKKDIQIVSIIGQIEGHNLLGPQTKATKYEHIIPLLTDAEQDDAVKGILLILNTAGGDVEAGLALAELVRGMSCLLYTSRWSWAAESSLSNLANTALRQMAPALCAAGIRLSSSTRRLLKTRGTAWIFSRSASSLRRKCML